MEGVRWGSGRNDNIHGEEVYRYLSHTLLHPYYWDKFECRPRGLQTAKRARTPQQPPQQQVVHQSDLVLSFKILLANRETPKPHQRAPMKERNFFTRTPSQPPQPRPQPQTHSRKPNSWCSTPSSNYKRYMMPHAKQKPTKSRSNERHLKKSQKHSNKHTSKSKQKL